MNFLIPDKKRTEKHTRALDNEIKKALECCVSDEVEECKNCPYVEGYPYCAGPMERDALDLINRLQAENERLNEKVKGFEKIRRAYQRLIHESMPNIQNALDNVLKELVGDNNDRP